MVTFRDITECKRGEKERKKLEEQLLETQKIESVGRPAGGAAYDFNNIGLTVPTGQALMSMASSKNNQKEITSEDGIGLSISR